MFLFHKSVFSVLALMLLLSSCSGSGGSDAIDKQKPFVTTWQTDNLGSTNDDQIKISTRADVYDYNFTVDWGDGSSDSNVSDDITHDYVVEGKYTVSISGEFPQIYFDIGGEGQDPQKLLSIEQWGGIEWQSMYQAFTGCSNLVDNATDVPYLALVTDMSFMFAEAIIFKGDLTMWDVSSVTSMYAMFAFAEAFNSDLSAWDVSSVTDMTAMFADALAFNGDLSAWDVSSVTDMKGMFSDTLAFNGDLSTWDVSSVTNMYAMFYDADAFNGDLGAWDVSSVMDMNAMFYEADAFNGDLSTWDVSSVTSMGDMFAGVTLSTENYNALLVGWSNQSLQSDVDFDAGNSFYSGSSQAARDVLTGTFKWSVIDGGNSDL